MHARWLIMGKRFTSKSKLKGGPVVSVCKELKAKCFPGSGGSFPTMPAMVGSALNVNLNSTEVESYKCRADRITTEIRLLVCGT